MESHHGRCNRDSWLFAPAGRNHGAGGLVVGAGGISGRVETERQNFVVETGQGV